MINLQTLRSSLRPFQKYLTLSAVCLLVFVGVGLRVNRPENYEFGFDQIQILQKAGEISHGDFSLVGPRTGPADLFTGPLVYYITAVLLMISNHSPYALVGMVGVISLGSALGLYILTVRAITRPMGLSLLAVWSCSPFFITLDRFAWNPLLSLISSAFVFFALISILKRQKVSVLDGLSIFFGSFLGYQAHFSCLILPFLIGVTLLVLKRKYIWTVIISLTGLFLSIVPTILFDLRQDWHNTRGLLAFMTNKDIVENKFDIFRFLSDVRNSFENIGKVFFSGYNATFLVLFGILIVLASFMVIKKNKDQKNIVILSLLWVFTIAICFSFYRESKPEYYFLVQFPAILVLILEVMNTFLEQRIQKAMILFFCIYGVIFTLSLHQKLNGFGMGVQYQVAKDVSARLSSGKVAAVHYGMKPIEALGIQFFVAQQGYSLAPIGSDIFVLYPVNDHRTVDQRFGAVGLWVDSRTDVKKNYLSLENYVLVTPKNITLLEDHYLSSSYDGGTVYQVIIDGRMMQSQLVVLEKKEYTKDLFDEILAKVVTNPWTEINIKQYQGKAFYVPQKDLLLVYIDPAHQLSNLSEAFSIE